MDRTELEAFARMKPVKIEVSPRDFMQLCDAINNPSEPNDALKEAMQRYEDSTHIPCYLPVTRESMRKMLGDPMQGVSLVGRMQTAEEQRAISDYLTRELGNQFQGVSLIVPESELEKKVN